MQYQIRVAGKIFQGTDFKVLLRRAVEAKRSQLHERLSPVRLTRPGDNNCVSAPPGQFLAHS
jgi:hypothetical protein